MGSVTKQYSADFYVITRKAPMHYPTAKANATEQKDYRKALRNNMTAAEAAAYGVTNGQTVSIEFDGPRCGVLGNVAIRAGEGHALECHVDTEEANALAITSDTTFKLIK